jgi:hypothetical protein
MHIDLCGPMNTVTPSGAKYFVLFKDDTSSFRVIYCIKQKSEALECLKKILQPHEIRTGHKIKILMNDRGKEYTSGEFQKFLEANGSRHELTCPYTLEQKNCTIMEVMQIMFYKSQVHNRFWGEATNTTIYLFNQIGSKTIGGVTPYEV